MKRETVLCPRLGHIVAPASVEAAAAQARNGTIRVRSSKQRPPPADARGMDRRAVIGVRRAPVEAAAAPSQPRSFEQAQAWAVGIAVALAGLRWLFVGTPTVELLLLVPFWFASTPVLAWAGGLGVSYWSKDDSEFLAIDGEARPLLAKAVLLTEMVASVGFAVGLFAVRIGTGGG